MFLKIVIFETVGMPQIVEPFIQPQTSQPKRSRSSTEQSRQRAKRRATVKPTLVSSVDKLLNIVFSGLVDGAR